MVCEADWSGQCLCLAEISWVNVKGVCPHEHCFPEIGPFERTGACLPHPLTPLSQCALAYSQRDRPWPVRRSRPGDQRGKVMISWEQDP